jgi:TonB-linked SusC/RagA family outer membrane protein
MKLKFLPIKLIRCGCTLLLLAVMTNGLPPAAFAAASHVRPMLQDDITVTGMVTSSEDGMGLPGVSIILKGTNAGTVTNQEGRYTIEVPGDATLVYSFVGFESQEVSVSGRTVIDIVLTESMAALQEVVVTALGIKREEKSLGYSVGRVGGQEFTRVAQENFLSSMAGKVSGVTINSTGGTGSTVSMIIRGAKSLSNDNQPLFVVDGVPLESRLHNIAGFGSDNRVDYGNVIADLDPESIESVSVLKGPSATALYGTRAGNGVVLITTKKANGAGMKVSVTSNTVFDLPVRYLNTQQKFSTGFFSFRPEDVGGGVLPPIRTSDGTGAGPETDKGYWAEQWDAPLDANGMPVPTEVVSYPDNVRDFLNDYAFTTTNGVSISNSSPLVNYRLGVTNMTHTGLIPNSDLNKNNLSLSASSKVRDNLTLSTDINFINSYADNRPANNRGTNPLQWAYSHPVNIDINRLRDYGTGTNIKRLDGDYENPWFLAHDVNNSFNRYQLFGNVVVNWDISSKFNLMGRVTMSKTDEVRETKIAPGYSKEPNNGAYGIASSNSLEQNMDVLATYKNEWQDFSLTGSVGGNVRYGKASSISNSSKSGSGLVVPNLFTVANISSGALDYSNFRNQRGMNSVYAMANLGWRDAVYLDLTARNDWSSTLPANNNSYFYPSASLSVILNELVDMGNKVDLLKIRGGLAEAGNDTDPYRLVPTYENAGQWGDAVRLGKQSGLLSPNLLPEVATSFEIGAELKMFSNRLRFEGTYFTIDNRNQILRVPLPASTSFTGVQINAGLLQSQGIELMLGVTPISTPDWNLDLNVNYTKTDTRILSLAEGIPFIEFWDQAWVKNIGYVKNDEIGEDGRIGNLYSRKVQRVTDETSPYYGYPILGSGLDAEWVGEEQYSKVGNYNPDFIMGMQTSLSYKNFTLSMTFDWRSGGQYVSQTFRYLSESVHTQTWLDELVHPGDLGGEPSQALRDWVVANADQLLLGDRLRPVGGPTPEYGGFPESFSGVTVYDGTFAPGVMGYHDENGKFILDHENLGNPGTVFLPYVVSYPWEIGQANMFDADYIKLREVSLNYRLPANLVRKLKMQDVNFSIYSRNIMLWTKDAALGVDPERAYQPEGGRFLQGVERYNVNPWVVPVGFKLGFTF